jgi:hypothetical protein
VAFDWIESHRGLKDHPKTVMLTAAWNDRKPCVLGHLHELWWWTLEYAPDGIIRPSFVPQVIAACEWHGKGDRFWSGLVESGFLEVQTDGSYAVHDWDEYAVRRIQRYEKENERKQAWREKAGRAGEAGQDAPAGRENRASGRPAGQDTTPSATSDATSGVPEQENTRSSRARRATRVTYVHGAQGRRLTASAAPTREPDLPMSQASEGFRSQNAASESDSGRAGESGHEPDATSGATGPTRARHQPDLPDQPEYLAAAAAVAPERGVGKTKHSVFVKNEHAAGLHQGGSFAWCPDCSSSSSSSKVLSENGSSPAC